VHDRGEYKQLQENMVITIEPGIYIPENANCDKKWWGIAVRIEDDYLLTRDGHEHLSSSAPRKVEDIEAMMKLSSPLDDFILPDLNKKN
jgi:Xaa-Pro aminopeptidase